MRTEKGGGEKEKYGLAKPARFLGHFCQNQSDCSIRVIEFIY